MGRVRTEPMLAQSLSSLNDHEFSRALTDRAGQLLLESRSGWHGSAAELGSTGDGRSHTFLMRGLGSARPADVILSEEGYGDTARRGADRVWIVDPLDGTREFGETRDDWAVHVALWQHDDLVAGAVSRPARARPWPRITRRRLRPGSTDRSGSP